MTPNKIFIFLCFSLILGAAPAWAHSFRSNFNLEVFEKGEGGAPDRYLGFTREEGPHTVEVLGGSSWYIRPIGRYSEDGFNRLLEDIRAQKLPGLSLSDRWDVSNDTLKPLERGNALSILLLGNTRVNDAGLTSLSHLSKLVRLSLPRQITDTKLAELTGLSALRDLNLSRSKITDKGLAILVKLPHLESLNVSGTRITDAGAETLGKMKSLKQLDISETAITDKGIKKLAACSNLESLYLNRHLTNAGLASLASLKKLKTLDLSGSRITPEAVAALKKMSRLQELALSGTRIGDAGMRYLAPLSDLRVLELSDTQITRAGLAEVGRLSRLETLSVSWDEITESEWQELAPLRHLTTVILNGSRMAPDVLNRVRDLAKLHAKGLRQTAMLESHTVPINRAPSRELTSIPASGQTLQEAAHPRTTTASHALPMPADLAPSPDQKRDIASEMTPRGKGMEFEVGIMPKHARASKAVMGLTGLKRVHEVEFEQMAGGQDLGLNENAEAAPVDLTPPQSVGEINVNIPAKAHRN